MNIKSALLKLKENLLNLKKEVEVMPVTYETDSEKKARMLLKENTEKMTVIYQKNEQKNIAPVLKYVNENGTCFFVRNLEYVKYLKKKYPKISDAQIDKIYEKKMSKLNKNSKTR